MDVHKEYEINSPQEYNGKEVKSVNDRFHKWLRAKTNRSFQLTDLRGSYGFRTANKNISAAKALLNISLVENLWPLLQLSTIIWRGFKNGASFV